MTECRVDDCVKTARSVRSGLCPMHYQRLRTSGRLDLVSAEERFWSGVDKGEKATGCWLWQGQLDSNGYGRFWVKPKTVYVHRYAYELLVGPIPDGLTIDHRCRCRNCVNPSHLAPETLQENVRLARSANAEKTSCPKGHPLDCVNSNGSRECSICKRERSAKWQRRRRTRERFDIPKGVLTTEDLIAWVVDQHRSAVERALKG